MTLPHNPALSNPRIWLGLDVDAAPPRVAGVRRKRLFAQTLDSEALTPVATNRLRNGTHCAAVMPSRFCLFRLLTPPDLPKRRIPRLLPGMLDIELPFPVEHCETRFLPFTDTEGFNRVLAIAVRHVDIDARLAQLSTQGFHPQVLLPEPWVLWQHARKAFADQPSNALCVLKWEHAPQHTLLAGRNGNLIWTVTGSTSQADALLDLCLKTHADALAAPPAIRDYADAVRITASPVADALVSVPPRERNMLDLRGRYAPHPVVVQARKTATRRFAAALCLAGACIGVTRLGAVYGAERRARVVQHQLQTEMNTLAGYRITRRGDAALEAVRDALDERMSAAIRLQQLPPPPQTLHRLLETAHENTIALHELQYNDGRWTVHGTGDSIEAVNRLLDRLQQYQQEWTLRLRAPESTPPLPFELRLEESP